MSQGAVTTVLLVINRGVARNLCLEGIKVFGRYKTLLGLLIVE